MLTTMEYQLPFGKPSCPSTDSPKCDQNLTSRSSIAVVNCSDQMSDAIATRGHTFHFEAGVEDKSSGFDDADVSVVDFAPLIIDDGILEESAEVKWFQNI